MKIKVCNLHFEKKCFERDLHVSLHVDDFCKSCVTVLIKLLLSHFEKEQKYFDSSFAFIKQARRVVLEKI